jgi:hypothetical protein
MWHIWDRQGIYMVLISRPEGKPQLEGLVVDGMLILKVSARHGVEAWTALMVVVKLCVL